MPPSNLQWGWTLFYSSGRIRLKGRPSYRDELAKYWSGNWLLASATICQSATQIGTYRIVYTAITNERKQRWPSCDSSWVLLLQLQTLLINNTSYGRMDMWGEDALGAEARLDSAQLGSTRLDGWAARCSAAPKFYQWLLAASFAAIIKGVNVVSGSVRRRNGCCNITTHLSVSMHEQVFQGVTERSFQGHLG